MFLTKEWIDALPADAVERAHQLYKTAERERTTGSVVYPEQEYIFKAFHLTPPDQIKAVILGQDPYHGPSQANGLAFSVSDGVPLPPSLRNIFKELEGEFGTPTRDGDLTRWAKQGVLLLNTSLTVEKNKPASHSKWGWEEFTTAVIRTCDMLPQPVVFVLWGAHAKSAAFRAGIDLGSSKTLISAHPSPFSARKGFFGSRPFSFVNAALLKEGVEPIRW